MIGAAARRAGLSWHWLPLDNGDPPPPERDVELRNALAELNAELDGGAALYLRCSAGIHRTGMIANALLRLHGLSSEQAQSALHELRLVTGQGVGQHRLQWGERIASSLSA